MGRRLFRMMPHHRDFSDDWSFPKAMIMWGGGLGVELSKYGPHRRYGHSRSLFKRRRKVYRAKWRQWLKRDLVARFDDHYLDD